MTRTRFTALGALGLAAALALTGCSAGSNGASDSGTKSIGTPDGKGKTLTVWVMDGDLTTEGPHAVETAVHRGHRRQGEACRSSSGTASTPRSPPRWPRTTRRTSSRSATPTCRCSPPAAGCSTSTSSGDLARRPDWLPGLAGPATVDGQLYGAPLFAGNRAVIYNKKIWADGRRHRGADHLRRADRGPGRDQGGEHRAATSPPSTSPASTGTARCSSSGTPAAARHPGRRQVDRPARSRRPSRDSPTWKEFQNTYSATASAGRRHRRAATRTSMFAAGQDRGDPGLERRRRLDH